MTGIIFDIKRFAINDGPGLRTVVFFKGCPLRCIWCHNPEGFEKNPNKVKKVLKLNGKSHIKEETTGYEISADKLFAEIEKERIFMETSGGGVTFSGGEPLLQNDFLTEILKICKKNDTHTTVDTSLFAPWETIKSVAEFTDMFLIDLKLMNSALHKHYTGVSNELIIENIKKLSATNVHMIIRIPVIPKVTTSDDNIKQTLSFLQTMNGKIKEINLLPFHNTANGKYKRLGIENPFSSIKTCKKEEIKDIEKQFISAGFKVKTGG